MWCPLSESEPRSAQSNPAHGARPVGAWGSGLDRVLDGLLLRRPLLALCVLWLSLVAVYQLDDSVVEEGDAVANVELPLSLLRTGSLHFSPRTSPIMFFWKSSPPLPVRDDFYVRHWFERQQGKAAGIWYATGKLTFNGPRYFVVKSPSREAYMSTFSVIPGLTFLPLAALLTALDGQFPFDTALRLSAAKLHASALVALGALMLFSIARRYVRSSLALLLTLGYAFGTCMWSIASETLWQQTVNITLLLGALLAYHRVLELPDGRGARVWRTALSCGLLLGTASASRPTAIFFGAAIALTLQARRPRALWPLLLGMAPIPLAVAGYNELYFGSPFNFAQELVGHQIAIQKTGAPGLWQTPLVVGVFGLLLSPSRGLLVFSPFLGLSFWGAVRLWSHERFAPLRAPVIAALLTMLLQGKWFDWWGGWAYGYRPWLEAVPMLVLSLIPVIDGVVASRVGRAALALALSWSVFVQALGAFSYDKYWNARDLYAVTEPNGQRRFFADESTARAQAKRGGAAYTGKFACNVDLRECRYRLWSLDDNIIAFYLHRYPVSREHRMHLSWSELEPFRGPP